MAWSHRKNARHRNSKKDVVRKAVCNKTKRKTKNEMAGWRVHRPEKDGDKRMERQSKGSRGLEAYCKGGQGPPRAVAPQKKKKCRTGETNHQRTTMHFSLNEEHLLLYIDIFHFHVGPKQCESTFLSNATRYVKEYFFVSRYTSFARLTSVSPIWLLTRRGALLEWYWQWSNEIHEERSV